MKGFIRCNMGIKSINSNGRTITIRMNQVELAQTHQQMYQAGFIADKELDCYIVQEYGAWMGNTEGPEISEFYQEYIDKGYELVLGPPAPPMTTGYGIFCSNYMELINSKRKKI